MKSYVFIVIVGCGLLVGCKKEKNTTNNQQNLPPSDNPYATLDQTYGFSMLSKIVGIWSGPLNSNTMVGSFPIYIADYRPISAAQVSAKNELNAQNDLNMSFFIAKYNQQYRLFFRNGGYFNGSFRISYFMCDSVSETSSQSYYRFSELKKGKQRAYTELTFVNDSLYMKTFTNKSGTQPNPVMHFAWNAKRQDTTSTQAAINLFQFPQKTLVKDFASTFETATESIYYSESQDPYKEQDQPHLGKITANYSFAPTFIPDTTKNVLLLLTTQPLYSQSGYNPDNQKFISRYVFVKSNQTSFNFNYVHPGTYYFYAIYDTDNNQAGSPGDWINVSTTTITLQSKAQVPVSTQINFVIP